MNVAADHADAGSCAANVLTDRPVPKVIDLVYFECCEFLHRPDKSDVHSPPYEKEAAAARSVLVEATRGGGGVAGPLR